MEKTDRRTGKQAGRQEAGRQARQAGRLTATDGTG